jgi:hypothetical protein
MYMNCAPVNIVPKGSHSKSKRESEWETLEARDFQKVNTAAQSALSSYPSLFVANLKSINDCVTKETQDIIFDAPGKDVAFADGKSGSVPASFGDGKCTGKGSDSAGSSSSSSSSPPPPSGNNGQWNGGSQSQPSSSQSSSSLSCANVGDGQWHPECYSGQKASSDTSAPAKPVSKKASAPQAPSLQTAQDASTGKQPSKKVEKELDEYATGLYSDSKTKRIICTEAKREPCASPHRWIKRNTCTWTCERKGRRAQLTPSTTTAPTAQAADLESELRNIESTITDLMDLASKKQQFNMHRRGSNNATETANSTLSEPEPSGTLDTFLTYLSRLQSTVVECIRNIAATTPSDSPVPVVEFVAAKPTAKDMSMSHKIKRQLVVPSLNSIISALKLDSSDPLYAALNALLATLGKVGELVGEKVGGGDVEGGLSALMSAVNATIGNANSTTDDLQNATDLATVVSAPAIANETLPFIQNATTVDADSTTDDLQDATDLATVDSEPAIANATTLLNATTVDANSTTNDLQNATDLTAVNSTLAIANATTLPFLQNATTVDANSTTNDLQNATDLTAVNSTLAIANATTLPVVLNATTVDANSTTNDLQNATDLTAVDSALAIITAKILPVLLKRRTIGDANATTLPLLQNGTTVDTNATTLPFLQNATTVDANSTTLPVSLNATTVSANATILPFLKNVTTLPFLQNATTVDVNSTTLPFLQNATTVGANATTLPFLQNATIVGANATTLPFLQNATTVGANATTLLFLQNATTVDSNSTTLPVSLNATTVDANSTTLPFLQNATTVDSNSTTLPVLLNATTVDANSTTLPFLQNATTVDANSTTNDLQNAADLAAALSLDDKANTPPSSSSLSPTTSPTPALDPSTAILPYLLGGPGPVIVKPGPVFSLPGPDAPLQSQEVSNLEQFPTVVNDLGEGSERDVRKFFEGLKGEDEDEE